MADVTGDALLAGCNTSLARPSAHWRGMRIDEAHRWFEFCHVTPPACFVCPTHPRPAERMGCLAAVEDERSVTVGDKSAVHTKRRAASARPHCHA